MIFTCSAVCKADQVESLLDRFSGRAPAEVLLADRYYQDLILHSPQLETTVMLVATRDLPLASLQRYKSHPCGTSLQLHALYLSAAMLLVGVLAVLPLAGIPREHCSLQHGPWREPCSSCTPCLLTTTECLLQCTS